MDLLREPGRPFNLQLGEMANGSCWHIQCSWLYPGREIRFCSAEGLTSLLNSSLGNSGLNPGLDFPSAEELILGFFCLVSS